MSDRRRREGALSDNSGETSFIAFDRSLFRSAAYKKLTDSEWRLYVLIKAHWTPGNVKLGEYGDNGEIRFTYKQAKGIPGLSGRPSFSRAIKGLEAKGWIVRERAGGFGQLPNLYRITWTHDKSGSKLDNPRPPADVVKVIERREAEKEVAWEKEREQRAAKSKALLDELDIE